MQTCSLGGVACSVYTAHASAEHRCARLPRDRGSRPPCSPCSFFAVNSTQPVWSPTRHSETLSAPLGPRGRLTTTAASITWARGTAAAGRFGRVSALASAVEKNRRGATCQASTPHLDSDVDAAAVRPQRIHRDKNGLLLVCRHFAAAGSCLHPGDAAAHARTSGGWRRDSNGADVGA